jgi:hypothetical protein
MFKLFSSDPCKKLQREYEDILTAAMTAQRKGDIRSYSNLMEKAESVRARIDEISSRLT